MFGVKKQGKISTGISFIFFGLVVIAILFGIYFCSANLLPKSISLPLLFGVALYSLTAFSSIFFGVVTLANGIKGHIAKVKGTKHECFIIEKSFVYTERYMHHHNLNEAKKYFIIVSFIGDSGQEHFLYIELSYMEYVRVDEGMMIECYVYKEDCYVDNTNLVIAR